jgi:hypothetical protein
MKPKKTKKPMNANLKLKRKLKLKKHTRYVSAFLTAGAVVCWVVAIYYVFLYTQVLNAIQTGDSGTLEGLLGNIFGILAIPAIAAQTLTFALVWGGIAGFLTLFAVIGWGRHW